MIVSGGAAWCLLKRSKSLLGGGSPSNFAKRIRRLDNERRNRSLLCHDGLEGVAFGSCAVGTLGF